MLGMAGGQAGGTGPLGAVPSGIVAGAGGAGGAAGADESCCGGGSGARGGASFVAGTAEGGASAAVGASAARGGCASAAAGTLISKKKMTAATFSDVTPGLVRARSCIRCLRPGCRQVPGAHGLRNPNRSQLLCRTLAGYRGRNSGTLITRFGVGFFCLFVWFFLWWLFFFFVLLA